MSDDTFVIGIPRCITCGFVIGGARQKIYNVKRLKKLQAASENGICISPDTDIDTDDILNELYTKNDCCRGHLITWKKFK
jgi:DNA-directed RNA polymerase subunit N (RpoN/RPB10)